MSNILSNSDYLDIIEEAKREVESERYYTPTEQDLIPGLAFELFEDLDHLDPEKETSKAEWNKLVYPRSGTSLEGTINSIYPLEEGRVRVKWLELTDLIEFGFEATEDYDIVRLKTPHKDQDNRFVYLNCLFKKYSDEIVIDLYHEFMYNEKLQQDRLYAGTCSNITEFKWIMAHTTRVKTD